MFSDREVQVAASNFVTVKIDPRSSRDAGEHKRTRYVPELVVLDPSQNYVTTIEAFAPQAMCEQLQAALVAANRRR